MIALLMPSQWFLGGDAYLSFKVNLKINDLLINNLN